MLTNRDDSTLNCVVTNKHAENQQEEGPPAQQCLKARKSGQQQAMGPPTSEWGSEQPQCSKESLAKAIAERPHCAPGLRSYSCRGRYQVSGQRPASKEEEVKDGEQE